MSCIRVNTVSRWIYRWSASSLCAKGLALQVERSRSKAVLAPRRHTPALRFQSCPQGNAFDDFVQMRVPRVVFSVALPGLLGRSGSVHVRITTVSIADNGSFFGRIKEHD